MSQRFVGRKRDLSRLQNHFCAVEKGEAGRLLAIRGRRQAGKSRLVTEFVEQTGAPFLFFTGSRQATVNHDLDRFVDDIATESTLPGVERLAGLRFDHWESALRQIHGLLPDTPSIVVFDEFPWLLENDPGLDGTLQKLWDRFFEKRPVLFILIGSDVAMMERLTQHDRPLYGRAKELVVEPFDPGDTAEMLDLENQPAKAIDAHLVTGGYPRLLLEWRTAGSWDAFLRSQLSDENSDFVVIGQRVIDAELPGEFQAQQVLSAIGAGERTFSNIATKAGIGHVPLTRSLDMMRHAKRLVAVDQPHSSRGANQPRYRVNDPYLRFWLRFIKDAAPDIARGRGDIVRKRINTAWNNFRGKAVEPLVREALARLAIEDHRLGGATHVGGYWTRTNNPEVDLVGLDSFPAGNVCFVGSIKWKAREKFDDHDLATLQQDAAKIPGAAGAPLIAVSQNGISSKVPTDALRAVYGPKDIISAWRR